MAFYPQSYESHHKTTWSGPSPYSQGYAAPLSHGPPSRIPDAGISTPGYPSRGEQAFPSLQRQAPLADIYPSMDSDRKHEPLQFGSGTTEAVPSAHDYISPGTMGPPPSSYGQPSSYPGSRRLSSVQRNPDPRSSEPSLPPGRLYAAGPPLSPDTMDDLDRMVSEEMKDTPRSSSKPHHSQKRTNRDEFDGPTQFLQKPPIEKILAQERDLPHVPINLDVREQDDVLSQVNIRLSQCAYDFVAKYQFPIPLEPDKRPVQKASDREWTEWVYLLKRLATKRRIPARLLYNGQIKQLVTVLENSLEMRHASAHQSRPPKDDRNVLQLISAGTQVAKMLKDASTMDYLDKLYKQTEVVIQKRKQGSMTHFR